MALKENYKDDILDTSQNVKRKYQMENNGDGTVSFTDVTEYTQQGDSFGSGAINPIAHAINGLNNYNFHPSGSIDLVALIADDSYYLDNNNKYVLADSPTGQALITSEPSTYKALASDTDLYGIEGEDTVSGFEPSSTPITVGGETLSTIDDKLNYLCQYKSVIDITMIEEAVNVNSKTFTLTQAICDTYSKIFVVALGRSASGQKYVYMNGVDQQINSLDGTNELRVGIVNNPTVNQTITLTATYQLDAMLIGLK